MKSNFLYCQYYYAIISGIIFLTLSLAIHAEDNMYFHGTLVDEPCMISAQDAIIPLDFGTVIDKELYNNTRTNGLPFTVHLSECDLSIGKTVKIMFNGVENTKIEGLLAIDPSSQASGIAIGIESEKGKLLPINKLSEKYVLENGSNAINMAAYLQGEPDAIKNHTIERGPFNAVARFSLEYE